MPRLLTLVYSAAGLASALSHIPQIRSAYRNPACAAAVSVSAWVSWTVSGVIAAVYALVCTHDTPFILVSIASAVGSAAVLGVALYGRRHADFLSRASTGLSERPISDLVLQA